MTLSYMWYLMLVYQVTESGRIVKEIRLWMASRWLKLSDDKTELAMFMSAHHQKTYGQCDLASFSCTQPWCRIQFKVIVMVFKCLHNEAPSYLCDLLQPRKVDSRLRSDSAIKLYQPIARKSVGERAFSVTAPKLWNNLPTDLRNLNALSVFKRKLKTHFFRQ